MLQNKVLKQYHDLGMKNILHNEPPLNPLLYKKKEERKEYSTFVTLPRGGYPPKVSGRVRSQRCNQWRDPQLSWEKLFTGQSQLRHTTNLCFRENCQKGKSLFKICTISPILEAQHRTKGLSFKETKNVTWYQVV